MDYAVAHFLLRVNQEQPTQGHPLLLQQHPVIGADPQSLIRRHGVTQPAQAVALPGLMGVDAVRAHAEQLRSDRTEGLPVL